MLTHSGIICHAVMVGWVSPLVCIADAMAIELSLHVYSLFIYFVFGICHPEKGSAMNLMNPKDSAQWESSWHRTAHIGE